MLNRIWNWLELDKMNPIDLWNHLCGFLLRISIEITKLESIGNRNWNQIYQLSWFNQFHRHQTAESRESDLNEFFFSDGCLGMNWSLSQSTAPKFNRIKIKILNNSSNCFGKCGGSAAAAEQIIATRGSWPFVGCNNGVGRWQGSWRRGIGKGGRMCRKLEPISNEALVWRRL